MPTPRKGVLLKVCLSVPPSEYLAPERITAARTKAKQEGHSFKSGRRTVRFDGVTLDVTVVTVRAAP